MENIMYLLREHPTVHDYFNGTLLNENELLVERKKNEEKRGRFFENEVIYLIKKHHNARMRYELYQTPGGGDLRQMAKIEYRLAHAGYDIVVNFLVKGNYDIAKAEVRCLFGDGGAS
jgi:hypothetical protein